MTARPWPWLFLALLCLGLFGARWAWQHAQQQPLIERFDTLFQQGLDCYRAQDWACSAESWGYAALLDAPAERHLRAVFNLGVLRFRLRQFDHAKTLFDELWQHWPSSGLHGLTHDQLAINRRFAISLGRALERWRADQRDSARRAAFKARLAGKALVINPGALAGGNEGFSDLGETSTDSGLGQSWWLSPSALASGSASSLGTQLGLARFIRSESDDSQNKDHNKAAPRPLLKRLFELEEGFAASLSKPRNRPAAPAGEQAW